MESVRRETWLERRRSGEEKQAIKQGRIPEGWSDKPAKLAQKSLPSGLTRGTGMSAGP